ncbi:CGNR zinc finger domain-containing protein [Cryptosporangium phraense]|uniref:CGNR zinc finger domain-containing protein n=1 Tax=Cryptosporangium phraense TaxID=2593070 RepID=A0A545AIL0_9ACTN|nr:CGNR zinc finger domain-containing protein [Cryptosporangium phraense]TQS41159.1 CGNR zinc finger domain-containing protein [Cryptosporangium phraense]
MGGDEELLLAVANTAHGPDDEFVDGESLRAWWLALGHPATSPAVDVEIVRALRVLIRGLALRNNGVEPDLGRAAGLESLGLRLDLGGPPSLRAEERGDLAREIAAATVTALLRATARPGWPRVKACRGDDCRWVFIDGSRNGSRRWCAMAGCGNRAKAATFRDRHRRTAPT